MKIASRIRLISVGLVLSTAILISVVVYWGFHSLVEQQQREGLEQLVGLEIKRMKTAFAEIRHDIRFLAEVPGISKIIHSRQAGMVFVETEEKERLAVLFKEILQSKPYYDQIRFIGMADHGKEMVRVERKGDRVVIIGESDLQQKGNRDYFTHTLQKSPGQVYFSKINLNREHGTIEIPYRPMLRASLSVYQPNGQAFGIIIINMNFKVFMDDLFPAQSERYSYFLTNPDGDFLVHPDSSHTFRFEFGTPVQAQGEFPKLTTLFMSSGPEYMTVWQDKAFSNPTLIHFRKARIFPEDPQRFVVFGVSASFRDVQAHTNTIILKVLAIAILLKLTGLALTFSLTTRLIKPLEWLTESTNRFAKGLTISPRPADPKDEIGTLSLAFDHMVHSINEKENQLASMNQQLLVANTDLDHFIHIASHDLREPARRINILADLVFHEGKEGASQECQDLLFQIQHASVNLLDQITDFRVFANISQGNLLRKATNMEKLIQSVTEEYATIFKAKKVSITIAPLPPLLVYENLVRVLYKNILETMLQQLPSPECIILFTAERSENTWILGISHTGSFLDQETLARVFEPLTRLSSCSSGSGLNLEIANRIIARHTGRIWVEPKLDSVHIRFSFGKEACLHENYNYEN